MGKGGRLPKVFQAVLFAATLGLLVYFCVNDNNLLTLAASLPGLQPFWLACCFACIGLAWCADSYVMHSILRNACGASYRYRDAFAVTMVGNFYSSITPCGVAGQPMQLLKLTRQGVRSPVALSALVNKFLVYQTTITAFSAVIIVARFGFFQQQFPAFMALAFIGFVAQSGSVLLLFFFSRNRRVTSKLLYLGILLLSKLHLVKDRSDTQVKVENQLETYLESNRAVRSNRRLCLQVYGGTLLQLLAGFSLPFFIYKAFRNPGFPAVDMLAAQSFIQMISAYIPLPGAAGAAEGSFLMVFQLFFSWAQIRQAMLLWRLLAYYAGIAVGSFFAGIGRKAQRLPVRFEGQDGAVEGALTAAAPASVEPKPPYKGRGRSG